jgi:hypothetical protein
LDKLSAIRAPSIPLISVISHITRPVRKKTFKLMSCEKTKNSLCELTYRFLMHIATFCNNAYGYEIPLGRLHTYSPMHISYFAMCGQLAVTVYSYFKMHVAATAFRILQFSFLRVGI